MVTDIDSLREIVARYARAVDGRDPAALLGLFTPDGVVTLPAELGRGVLPTELRGADVARLIDGVRYFDRTRHVVDRFDATVDGDVAHGTTVCTAHHVTGGRDLVLDVTYQDTFARHDGQWRLAGRALHVTGSRRAAVGTEGGFAS